MSMCVVVFCYVLGSSLFCMYIKWVCQIMKRTGGKNTSRSKWLLKHIFVQGHGIIYCMLSVIKGTVILVLILVVADALTDN